MERASLVVVDLHEYHSFSLRGEGRANFVVSASCEQSGERIVWRLAKHRKSGLVSTKPKCELVLYYFDRLIAPLLGRHLLARPKAVRMDLQCLHHLAKVPALPLNTSVHSFHQLIAVPSSSSFLPRQCTSTGSVLALQMRDATWMDNEHCHGPTITFEIKPKQGFMQQHPDVLLPYCNNCILQMEKCYSETYERMYDFCPLDLYSGQLDRMHRALTALVSVPHRNLRVFIDGAVVHSDELHSSVDQLSDLLRSRCQLALCQLITAVCCVLSGSSSAEDWVLHRDSVLSRLLAAQKIDTIGIVQAYRIYNSLSQSVQRQLLSKRALPRRGLTSLLNSATDRALLERYLLAATVKDCSLMISLRVCNPPSSTHPSLSLVRLSPSLALAYNISVVDLDPKSPKNLLNAYDRFMRGVKLLQNTAPARRPCMHTAC